MQLHVQIVEFNCMYYFFTGILDKNIVFGV